LIFPIALAGMLGLACFVLGLAWRVFSTRQIPQKIAVFAGALTLLVAALSATHLVSPLLIERWTQRLFFSAQAATDTDLSVLTRKAEAAAMWKSVSADSLHFIIGKGMGANYYWDASFWPELYTVFPTDYDFSQPIWFNGHSVWTYTLFSGGLLGILFHITLFISLCILGLRAVRVQSDHPDPETWTGFLPLFVVGCLLVESVTSNQLAERLTGVMLGLAGGVPQALMMRSARRRRTEHAPNSLLTFSQPVVIHLASASRHA
jgi:hypothetical protein